MHTYYNSIIQVVVKISCIPTTLLAQLTIKKRIPSHPATWYINGELHVAYEHSTEDIELDTAEDLCKLTKRFAIFAQWLCVFSYWPIFAWVRPYLGYREPKVPGGVTSLSE